MLPVHTAIQGRPPTATLHDIPADLVQGVQKGDGAGGNPTCAFKLSA